MLTRKKLDSKQVSDTSTIVKNLNTKETWYGAFTYVRKSAIKFYDNKPVTPVPNRVQSKSDLKPYNRDQWN